MLPQKPRVPLFLITAHLLVAHKKGKHAHKSITYKVKKASLWPLGVEKLSARNVLRGRKCSKSVLSKVVAARCVASERFQPG